MTTSPQRPRSADSAPGTSPSPLPVLFLGGIGRSGSTVFELSLGTDDRVVALGEVVHLWQRCLLDRELCGCGKAFADCQFWSRVGDVAFGGWDRVDARRVIALKKRIDRTVRTPQLAGRAGGRKWNAEVAEYASYYARVYRAAAEISRRAVVIDSSKQASLPFVLRRAEGLDLRILHCVRDSRAVAYAWTKTVRRPEALSANGAAYMKTYPPAILALKWMQHNATIEALRLLRVPTMRVRYEDWAAAPTATVERALNFAGLERRVNPRLNDEWIDLTTTHTCSGNPMRFTRGRVEIRRDERWRTALAPRSRRLVSALTAPGLAGYGYLGTP